jgi:hypothetical protein
MARIQVFTALAALLIMSVAVAAAGSSGAGGSGASGHASAGGAGHATPASGTLSRYPKIIRNGSNYAQHQDEARCAATRLCASRKATELLDLRAEAQKTQRQDGGRLSPQHRAELQSKLDAVLGQR